MYYLIKSLQQLYDNGHYGCSHGTDEAITKHLVLTNLPRVTQIVSGRARFNKRVMFQNPLSFMKYHSIDPRYETYFFSFILHHCSPKLKESEGLCYIITYVT